VAGAAANAPLSNREGGFVPTALGHAQAAGQLLGFAFCRYVLSDDAGHGDHRGLRGNVALGDVRGWW
jgi:hypothetical protein